MGADTSCARPRGAAAPPGPLNWVTHSPRFATGIQALRRVPTAVLPTLCACKLGTYLRVTHPEVAVWARSRAREAIHRPKSHESGDSVRASHGATDRRAPRR